MYGKWIRRAFTPCSVFLCALCVLCGSIGRAGAEAAPASGPAGAKPGVEADLGSTFEDRGPGAIVRPPSLGALDPLDDPETAGLLDRRTEAAIRRGLQFLKTTQAPDGRWGAADDTNWVAYTAFAMIAYMLNGHFPNRKPPYGEPLTRALDRLLKESEGQISGYMGTNMYAHGLATVALSEAWGQTDKDGEVQEVLKAAVKVILRSQNEAGGWRYNPQPGGADVSVTAMQVVALAAARQAGTFVPDDTIDRAVRYVNMAHHTASGGFTYMPGFGVAGFARTAAATCSLQMLGRHEAKEVKAGIRYLQQEAPEAVKNTHHYMYGMYYATLCLYLAGDEAFRAWYPQVRDVMLARQAPDGSVGRRSAYDTSIATIILSVPYGYVPAYQR
jgi:hypothetical protein